MRGEIILILAFVFLALPIVIADNSDFVKLEQSRLAVINPVGTTVVNGTSSGPAPVILNEGLIVNSGPVSPVPVEPLLDITLISPNSASSFSTSSNLEIDFNFITQAYGFMDADYPIVCIIELSSDTESIDLTTEMNDSTGVGSAKHSLVPGNYDWIVICDDGAGRNWRSNEVSFVVNQEINNGGSSGNNGGGGSSRRNNEEEGGRRVIYDNNLTLEELSTSNPEPEGNNGDNGGSAITGAVIGLLGKKGAIGFGILLVVLGVSGLIVYNREYLGLVKAK